MKIELINNKKVILEADGTKKEIHPFWLRERVAESEHLDPGTQQRLFDPATMNFKIDIDEANLDGDYLNVKFNDGISSKYEIKKLSSLVSPTGKEQIVPIPIFRCDDCGNINDEFLPKSEKK